ncbi:MAG TPA: hypothetical protein DEQ09_09160 [Bacteroidales bacterium]|nr:hypothetical protein [Bacteroidales bacterium]
MKTIYIQVVLILLTVSLTAQNMIGYKPDKIEKYIRNNYKYLVKESNSRNEYYKYLKYTDGVAGMTTVYFFLSENNKCSRVKSMYVHSLKDEVIEELDSLYTRKGPNLWTDRNKRIDAVIKLVNEEWFFTVTIEPERKE